MQICNSAHSEGEISMTYTRFTIEHCYYTFLYLFYCILLCSVDIDAAVFAVSLSMVNINKLTNKINTNK